ncbi:MAG TPA: glycosyltransferase family 2 protein [Blastocatellia bacterium]|nr:glycosyltransferase family 2 protein [Blastocatellia bacterium]
MWAVAFVWLLALAYNLVSIRTGPRLTRNGSRAGGAADAPLVSVLVPARNEAGRILAESVRSMLAQDYPRFEVIAVDDRSSDSTLEILREIAREDARLTVIRGEPLPAGWIGKPWAMEQARRASGGEWLLATDADMTFDASALRLAMNLALSEGYDALTLAPNITSSSFWGRLVMPIAGWLILLLYPVWKVNDPRSDVALGIGGFLLMRRAAHDHVGGYEAIRADVTDDLSTARLLKRAGFRLHLAAAPDLISTPMYSNLRELFEGFGKNAFVGSGGSALRAIAGAVGVVSFTTAPLLIALVATAIWLIDPRAVALLPVALAGFAAYLALVASFVPLYLETKLPPGYAFLSFLGHGLMALILLSSTWRVLTGRGVVWKSRNLYAPAADAEE